MPPSRSGGSGKLLLWLGGLVVFFVGCTAVFGSESNEAKPRDSVVAAPQTSLPRSTATAAARSSGQERGITDTEAERIAYVLMVRLEFPLIDAVLDSDPHLEHVLFDLGGNVCEAGRISASSEQLSLALLLMWDDLDGTSRLFFNGEPTGLAEFAGIAMAALCPTEANRLLS